jgi:hypothetical protein
MQRIYNLGGAMMIVPTKQNMVAMIESVAHVGTNIRIEHNDICNE